MAWDSPLDPPGTIKAAFIGGCEWVYLAIFTTEMLCKILAYGFILQDGSYLRDAWCQLDFLVVTLAWAPILIPSFGSYSVIRAFRALRPLRALKRMPYAAAASNPGSEHPPIAANAPRSISR
jgi:uncharacterized membrane protein YcjF (UPF0283 family)